MGISPATTITPEPGNATDPAALYRLMNWLSPSYPVGAFSYSHGLEWAVETGEIRDVASLAAWVSTLLTSGSGRNDAIIFHAAYWAAEGGDVDQLWDIAELAAAFTPSRERQLETLAQGAAFCRTTRAAWAGPMIAQLDSRASIPYPVAVAAAASDHGIGVAMALHAYIHAFAANLVSAAVRLVPLGHTDGQHAIAALETPVEDTTAMGLTTDLSQLGGGTVTGDMASMHHEIQYTRLFRS